MWPFDRQTHNPETPPASLDEAMLGMEYGSNRLSDKLKGSLLRVALMGTSVSKANRAAKTAAKARAKENARAAAAEQHLRTQEQELADKFNASLLELGDTLSSGFGFDATSEPCDASVVTIASDTTSDGKTYRIVGTSSGRTPQLANAKFIIEVFDGDTDIDKPDQEPDVWYSLHVSRSPNGEFKEAGVMLPSHNEAPLMHSPAAVEQLNRDVFAHIEMAKYSDQQTR